MKIYYNVLPKKNLHDPQGEAIKKVLDRLGVVEVSRIRVGKLIELEIDRDELQPVDRRNFEKLGQDFFSNPLVEDVEFLPKDRKQ